MAKLERKLNKLLGEAFDERSKKHLSMVLEEINACITNMNTIKKA